jgi:hypothetical protein
MRQVLPDGEGAGLERLLDDLAMRAALGYVIAAALDRHRVDGRRKPRNWKYMTR